MNDLITVGPFEFPENQAVILRIGGDTFAECRHVETLAGEIIRFEAPDSLGQIRVYQYRIEDLKGVEYLRR